MSAFCEHGDYGQACAQCHYEAHDGKCCCDSCHLIRCRKRIATLEQQNAELVAALEKALSALETCTPADYSTGNVIYAYFDDAACAWAEDTARATLAKVKQP